MSGEQQARKGLIIVKRVINPDNRGEKAAFTQWD